MSDKASIKELRHESSWIDTERLQLKPIRLEDAEFIFHLMNTPSWYSYIGNRQIRAVKEARNYIQEKMLPQYERLGYANYVLVRKSDGKKLGTCGLYDRPDRAGIDLGFALLPQYERQGYAQEASQAVVGLAFQTLGIDTLYAYTTDDNYSSQKLLAKLGFNPSSRARLAGDAVDLQVYTLYKDIK